jgi:glycosyltransferase involved in cell wall biosynthesis
LALVTAGLGAGGAERVISWMANWWADAGHLVSLATLDDSGQAPFYPLDDRVHLVRLGVAGNSRHVGRALTSNLRRVRALRRHLDTDPNVVISFLDVVNVLVLLASWRRPWPVVVSERVDPYASRLPAIWRVLRRATYNRASRVVVQTESVLRQVAGSTRWRCAVIPNPVAGATGAFGKGGGSRRLLSIGRLTHQKGIDILLRAFANVAADFPEWRLAVVGDGPLRAELAALATSLGLQERVEWMGMQRADAVLASAEIFVLPSRFEGFPNALCEAMAHGLAVIATDCPSGPREIVRHEVDGLLVAPEDPRALAGAIRRLLLDPDERRRLGERAGEVTERFSPAKIMRRWEELLLEVMTAPGPLPER